MNNPKVSIILPVYNVEKYITRCLDSICNQTLSSNDIEVILVDDGSKDSSGRICDSFCAQNKNFKVIHQDNKGAAAARNAGLKKATGDYIAFVDPDDYVDNEYCRLPYEKAINTGADIVIFDAIKESENKKTDLSHAFNDAVTDIAEDLELLRCQILYPYTSAKMGKEKFISNIPLAAPWDKLYKNSFLKEHNLTFPNELKVLDDMSFNFVAFGKAGKVAYLHRKLYHYQVWQSSITNSYKADRPLQDMKVFEFLKNEIEKTKNQDTSRLIQSYYARVIKSFAICCRLSFFNKKNPENMPDKLKNVKKYMKTYPYVEAFEKINIKKLEWKLVIVAAAGKIQSPAMLRLLDLLQN